MIGYYKADPWSIVEEGFDPSMQEASESIFSLGNGRMGGARIHLPITGACD